MGLGFGSLRKKVVRIGRLTARVSGAYEVLVH